MCVSVVEWARGTRKGNCSHSCIFADPGRVDALKTIGQVLVHQVNNLGLLFLTPGRDSVYTDKDSTEENQSTASSPEYVLNKCMLNA